MSVFRLILRNLLYFRGVNLAVVAGIAVGTAVLSGALMVGDSVRASLADLAVRRLGRIDHALIGGRFFDASLAKRVNADPAIKGRFEIGPAVIARGSAAIDSPVARTTGVQIIGAGDGWLPVARGSAVINALAADELGLASSGNEIMLSVPAQSAVPRDATLAHRSRQDVLSGIRARVARVVSEPGMISLFSPAGGQRTPKNVWTNLADIQDAIDERGRANALFVHESASTNDGAAQLNAALHRVATLVDFGLTLAPVGDGTEVALTSRTTYLDPATELAADRVAGAAGIAVCKISVNLINTVGRISDTEGIGPTIHYAVAAGMSSLGDASLAEDEIALNQWAADRLGAVVGNRITLTFYQRQADGGLAEVSDVDRGFSSHFRVARILPMNGIGSDPSLTPAYKGLTDAISIASWNPPAEVKIDRSLVTEADEAYWKAQKAAPKLFLSFASARRLWGNGLGDLTSIRVPASRGDEFARKLLAELDPASMGMSFRPLKQEQIAAASGTTDFGQLFVGFSFFLIVAAALLVAMLVRLGVEQRARQIGALSAIGFSPSSLKRVMLAEGMLLSVAGGIAGSFAAVAYTWLMMAGLRTWWIGATGTKAMRLYIVPQTLLIGLVSSQGIAFVAILWALWRVGRSGPAKLLAGGWEGTRPFGPGLGWVNKLLGGAGLIAGLSIVVAASLGRVGQQIAFLSCGAILLGSSLCLLAGILRANSGDRSGVVRLRSVVSLGIRNATRHTARSVMCIGLIALAAFALVTVAAMRQGEPTDTGDSRSGAGGFQLIIETEISLLGNPSNVQGRTLLGFRDPSNPIWDRVEFLPMRRRAGQDVSCLNLTQATSPTVLAVPASLVARGGFTRSDANPWKLLEARWASGAIPIIADDTTAKYILHLALGDHLDVTDSSGSTRRLRLVATLPHSIFQSQLLVSEENFRDMFPAESGFGVVLVRVRPEDQAQVHRLLREELNEYGASVRTTASVLAGYLEIQNTYLSTFELLGALGLMLGTIGLATVLVRTIIERKAELALLTSLGFCSASRTRLVLAENAFLLVTGLVVGSACALIAVVPALRESAGEINYFSLALTLTGALLTGLLASGFAVKLGGARVTTADLRKE